MTYKCKILRYKTYGQSYIFFQLKFNCLILIKAVQCCGKLALQYSTRCTDVTSTTFFVKFFNNFKARQPIMCWFSAEVEIIF